MSAVTVRAACAGDHDAIWALLEPVVREGTTYPCAQDMTREAGLAYWFAPDKQVLVALRDGTILGSYYLKPNSTGPAAHVCNAGYITLPAARGTGVASAMARDSFARARALGYRAMQFNLVVATNVVAVALWQKLGMETVGRLPGAFHHPELGYVDALVMYRTL